MSNHRGGPTKRTLITVTFIAVAVVGSLAAYVKYTPANRATNGEPVLHQKPHAPDVKIEGGEETQDRHVRVFTPFYEGTALKFSADEVVVLPGENEKVRAVNEFLKASKITDPAARLLGLGIVDGVATLSFNEAFRGGYGTDDEHTLIDGLRITLGQFPEIEKVVIMIDGKPVESLGSVEIAEGLTVTRPSTLDGASPPPQTN